MKKFIEEFSAKIEKLELTLHHAWWNLATTGEEKYAAEYSQAKIAIRKLFSSKEDFYYLKGQKKSADRVLDRQRVLLLNQFIENQIPIESIEKISRLESHVESIYTSFRPEVDGKFLSNNDVKKILTESTDSEERRKAWEASKIIGEKVEQDVLTLISLRNKAAKDAGFPDFFTMQLKLQELEENELFAILDELDKTTSDIWKTYKTHLNKIMPWDYQDPFFQEAPKLNPLEDFYAGKDVVALSSEFFKTIGLPVDDIIARSDLYERDKKNQHAFCSCLDRKMDIRVLCNIRPDAYWMGTLLHELGHAVYDKYIDQSLPFLLRTPSHILTTEASAMLFGRLEGEHTQSQLLVFSRWVMVMVHFERAMYQEPGKDLNGYWWELVERFQNVRPIPGRNKPDWAAKLHLACAPVYYQNYLLGEMFASQLLHTVEYQDLPSKLYKIGATLPWNETILHATGEVLTSKYFALDLK